MNLQQTQIRREKKATIQKAQNKKIKPDIKKKQSITRDMSPISMNKVDEYSPEKRYEKANYTKTVDYNRTMETKKYSLESGKGVDTPPEKNKIEQPKLTELQKYILTSLDMMKWGVSLSNLEEFLFRIPVLKYPEYKYKKSREKFTKYFNKDAKKLIEFELITISNSKVELTKPEGKEISESLQQQGYERLIQEGVWKIVIKYTKVDVLRLVLYACRKAYYSISYQAIPQQYKQKYVDPLVKTLILKESEDGKGIIRGPAVDIIMNSEYKSKIDSWMPELATTTQNRLDRTLNNPNITDDLLVLLLLNFPKEFLSQLGYTSEEKITNDNVFGIDEILDYYGLTLNPQTIRELLGIGITQRSRNCELYKILPIRIPTNINNKIKERIKGYLSLDKEVLKSLFLSKPTVYCELKNILDQKYVYGSKTYVKHYRVYLSKYPEMRRTILTPVEETDMGIILPDVVLEAWDELTQEIKGKIEDKLKGLHQDVKSKIAVAPFNEQVELGYNKPIVISVKNVIHGWVYTEFLKKHKHLILNLRELGYSTSTETNNVELNADGGDASDIEKIKKVFPKTEWDPNPLGIPELDEARRVLKERKEEIEEERLDLVERKETVLEDGGRVPDSDDLKEIFEPITTKDETREIDALIHLDNPACIILLDRSSKGDGTGGKVIEDLLKEKLKYWGFYTQKSYISINQYVPKEEKTADIPDERIPKISDSEMSVVYLQLSYNYLEEHIEKIVMKLREAESLGLRYIILHIYGSPLKLNGQNDPYLSTIRKIQEELVNKSSIDYFVFKLPSEITNTHEELVKKKFEILDKLVGVSPRISGVEYLDDYWVDLRHKYNELLIGIKQHINGSEEFSDLKFLPNESDEHYMMRGMVLNCLLGRYQKDKIKLEESIYEKFLYEVELEQNNSPKKIKPDFTVTERGKEDVYIEVETCIPCKEEKERSASEIINPEVRLKRKLEKYKEHIGTGKLWVVLPSMFAYTHKKVLRNIKNYLKTRFNIDATFKTLEIENSKKQKLVTVV